MLGATRFRPSGVAAVGGGDSDAQPILVGTTKPCSGQRDLFFFFFLSHGVNARSGGGRKQATSSSSSSSFRVAGVGGK